MSNSASSSATTASQHTPSGMKKPSDFQMGRILGQGAFAEVYKAKELSTNSIVAIKVISKRPPTLREQNDYIKGVFMEKEVLRRCWHPFIIGLRYTFHDSERLYYVIEYAPRGELRSYLNTLTCFDIECTRFYGAEILCALEYLHKRGICHRDLKPENILLDANMHIKLIDFASATITHCPIDGDRHLDAMSFTGTPQYVSPEMLSAGEYAVKSPDNKYTYLMDFWAFGCIIYQFISGRYPFRGLLPTSHGYEIFQKILLLKYEFPLGFEETAKDLVQRLLVLKPQERLGSPEKGGHDSVKNHPFFTGIPWSTLPETTPPELVPNLPEVVENDDWDSVPVGFRHEISYEFQQDVNDDAKKLIIKEQAKNNSFHRFVDNALILKQGMIKKRRGLSAKWRMFLLTEGPRLIYVDPTKMVRKGEVPWSAMLTFDRKSECLFLIVTPGRTYILECTSSKQCSEWLERLQQVKNIYYQQLEESNVKEKKSSRPSQPLSM